MRKSPKARGNLSRHRESSGKGNSSSHLYDLAYWLFMTSVIPFCRNIIPVMAGSFVIAMVQPTSGDNYPPSLPGMCVANPRRSLFVCNAQELRLFTDMCHLRTDLLVHLLFWDIFQNICFASFGIQSDFRKQGAFPKFFRQIRVFFWSVVFGDKSFNVFWAYSKKFFS